MDKKFTLIEMVAVCSILLIVAAILIANIADKREIAMVGQIHANTSALQSVMDIYSFENNGMYASKIQPTLEQPQLIDFEKLYPKYIREIPRTLLYEYYWVDFMGKVWASTIDAPTDISEKENQTVWKTQPDVKKYNIYEVFLNKNTLRTMNSIYFKETIENAEKADTLSLVTENVLLISSFDKYGLETVPVGVHYIGTSK